MASRVFRPSSAPAGMDSLNSETASVAGGSTISVAFEAARFCSEKAAVARPTAPSPAAASSTPRREVASVIVSSVGCQAWALPFARAAWSRAGWPGADAWSLELEDEDGPGLGHDRRGFVDRVQAVLDPARIEVPACGDGDVLLAVDLEGGGNADGAGRQREAPQLVAGAGVERPELPILRPAREQDVPGGDQQRRPEVRLEIVLPHLLAGVQVPGLQLTDVVLGAGASPDRPEDVVDLVAQIAVLGVLVRDLALREVRAEVVVRRDVEEFCLRAPRLGWPVFAATNARAELGALFRARSLGLVDGWTAGLRVNRGEDVVIGKRESVQELEAIAIQDPKVTVPASVGGRLGELPIDLGVDQERRRDFIPVKAVVRGVLVIALDLAGVGVERERRVRVEIVARPGVGHPGPRVARSPVGRVRGRIIDPGDPG